jgi:hypothetical protein
MPKLLYEHFPFRIGTKLQKWAAFFWRNDVCGVLCQPKPIVGGKSRDSLLFLYRVRFRALHIETSLWSNRLILLRWRDNGERQSAKQHRAADASPG